MGGGSTQVSFELQPGEKDHRVVPVPVGTGWASPMGSMGPFTLQDRIPVTDFYQFQTALGKAGQSVGHSTKSSNLREHGGFSYDQKWIVELEQKFILEDLGRGSNKLGDTNSSRQTASSSQQFLPNSSWIFPWLPGMWLVCFIQVIASWRFAAFRFSFTNQQLKVYDLYAHSYLGSSSAMQGQRLIRYLR